MRKDFPTSSRGDGGNSRQRHYLLDEPIGLHVITKELGTFHFKTNTANPNTTGHYAFIPTEKKVVYENATLRLRC